jgi:hypothetical protein
MSFSNSSNKLLQSLQSNITVEILLKGEKAFIYSYFNWTIPKNKLSSNIFRHLPSCSKLTGDAVTEFSSYIFA